MVAEIPVSESSLSVCPFDVRMVTESIEVDGDLLVEVSLDAVAALPGVAVYHGIDGSISDMN